MDLTLRTDVYWATSVVTVGGEVDLATGPTMKQYLVDLIDDGARDVLLDLDLVSFFDSTGLAVLISARKRLAAHGGTVGLVCSQERILKLLRITQLDRVFPIHTSIAGAIGVAEPRREPLIPRQQGANADAS